MRIALLVAEPPTTPNAVLRRHARRLAIQFRDMGMECVLMGQARGGGGLPASLPPGFSGMPGLSGDPGSGADADAEAPGDWAELDATGGSLAQALADIRPDVLHVLHGLDGTGVLIGDPLPCPAVMQLHPPATLTLTRGAGTRAGGTRTRPSTLHELRPDGGFLALVEAVLSPSRALYLDLAGSDAALDFCAVPLGADYQVLGPRRARGAGGPVHVVVLDDLPDDRAGLVPGAAEADVLALPGLTYGLCSDAVIEAVARGTLIVGPDVAGVRELIRDLRCGLGYNSSGPGALQDLLGWLEADPALVQRARQEMRYPPGVEEEAFAIASVYRRLSSGGVRRRPEPQACRLLGWALDQPQAGAIEARAVVRLLGWALSGPSPVARIDVTLNGRPCGLARMGLERPDVAAMFDVPQAPVCGFEMFVDLGMLPGTSSRAVFDVTVHAADGSAFVLPQLEVELAKPEDDHLESLRRSADLRVRETNAPILGPGASPDRVNLVAFSHDLNYGGAQLYLWELLRQLASELWFSCTVVSPADGPLATDLRAAGIHVHLTSFPVSGIEAYEGRLAELGAWIRAEGFNVVLGNTLLAFPLIDLASRLALPSVWAIHESYELPVFWKVIYPPSAPIHPYAAQRAVTALAASSKVVFEADATRALFEPYAPADHLITVPYGVDAREIDAYRRAFDKAKARVRLDIPPAATVLLCLGTISSRKSQTLIAQAFHAVAQSYPDAFCVFVGSLNDNYAQALVQYLDRSGLATRTMVIPVVADTYEWYALADLFVSASDVESLPRSVLEAMLFDLPVAATAVFGLPELLEDGRTGHLCRPGDLNALAEMLDRHLSMIPAQASAMAASAAALARKGHDSAGYAQAYAALLRDLAGAAPARVPIDEPGGALLVGNDDLGGMSREISPYDTMMDTTPAAYFAVTASARRSIRLALATAGVQPWSILDFACGHGRVLRVLRHDFPEAKITACDMDRAGVDFCSAAFGAIPVYGSPQPEDVELGGPFDLIWSGSLMTHLDQSQWLPVLRMWASSLVEGGVLVFTTHGRLVANRMAAGKNYGLDDQANQQALTGFRTSGFGYGDYPGQPGYGISISSPAWILKLLESVPELRLLMFEEAAWDHHQDVVACVRDAKQRIPAVSKIR